MKLTPRRLIRYYYLRFKRLKGDPNSIARGVALGVFVGITPTLPFHTVALLITIPLFKANVVASFLSSMSCCNPLTYFPQYYFSWKIGNYLTPHDLSWEKIKGVMDIIFSDGDYGQMFTSLSSLGLEVASVLLIGGTILAAPFSFVSYFVSLRFFTKLREKRGKARARRRQYLASVTKN